MSRKYRDRYIQKQLKSIDGDYHHVIKRMHKNDLGYKIAHLKDSLRNNVRELKTALKKE